MVKQVEQNKNTLFLPGLMLMIYKNGQGIYTSAQGMHLIQLSPDLGSQNSQYKWVLFELYN